MKLFSHQYLHPAPSRKCANKKQLNLEYCNLTVASVIHCSSNTRLRRSAGSFWQRRLGAELILELFRNVWANLAVEILLPVVLTTQLVVALVAYQQQLGHPLM
eukprot:scpid109457/ scgid7639/ 